MVSVIIPVYNAETVLADTIESVLGQTYKDFELLLVDDGSTDRSPNICDEYAVKDSRVVALRKPNGGVSSARNYGLDHARGEFISFVDNDDCLYPEFLETMVGSIGSFDYLLASYVEGGVEEKKNRHELKRCDKVKRVIDACNLQEVHDKASELRLMGFGAIWCTLFRKSILDKYGIRFHTLQYEDTLFIYEYVAHCNNMRKIIYEGYFCFYHNDSQGHSHKYIAEMEAIGLLDKTFDSVVKHFNIIEESLISIFRWRLRSAIRSFLLKGYYRDTKASRKKRIGRWRDIRSHSFIIEPYVGKCGTVDSVIHFVLSSRLYNVLDPIIALAIVLLKK